MSSSIKSKIPEVKAAEVKAPEVSFFENYEYLLRLFKKTINDAVKGGYKGFLHANLITLVEKNLNKYTPAYVIESFIIRSFKYWDMINTDNLDEKDPDELKKMQQEQDDFVYENASILFSGIDNKIVDINKVAHELYKVKFSNNQTIITDSCRMSVMKTLKSFIKFSIRYLNLNPLIKERISSEIKSVEDKKLFNVKIEEYTKKLFTTE